MITDVHISVRELIEFILRSGDIDNRKETGADPDAMQEGIRIHKMIQKMMPSGYVAEYTLREEFVEEDLHLTVEGRADGLWTKEEDGRDVVIVDEIKSMYANLNFVEHPKPLHLAQAKCYAAMYAEAQVLEDIDVQITYCDIDTEDIKRFRYRFSRKEVREWFLEVVEEYRKWARMQAEHCGKRNASIAALTFPYEYRPGQKNVARDVYRAIARSRNLFINAPTGTGKTLSTVYPALKAMGEGLSDKLFYLTAKTLTATVATDTFFLLEQSGLDIRAVHLTAREKSCANDLFDCNPDACPFADGHYDRINAAVFDLVTRETVITREIILDYAEKHRVCPYEFSLDVSDWCDAVIGDYNYAFDPRVKLRRYFCEGAAGNYIFLIDEAHNLVQRACEMYSAAVVKENLLACNRMTKGMSKSLTNALTGANRQMLALKRECEGEYRLYGETAELYRSLQRVTQEISKLLEKQKFFDTRREVLEVFFETKRFCDVYEELERGGYRIYGTHGADGSFRLKLLCIDPSQHLSDCLLSARSAVFFSATLLPMPYYKELLSGDPEDYAIYAETVFTRDQRLLAVGKDVTTRYTRRDDAMYGRIADYIRTTAAGHIGNYMAYFPSYEFLRRVAEKLLTKGAETDGIRYRMQEPNMREADREEFLAEFGRSSRESLVGLCVMGGIFSEGIDLTDDRLIGVMVVGTGLPMINTESQIARDYFDSQGKDGFAYAYRYPGMNKVLQAAGRVIRKETDHGIILLLDQRFAEEEYRSLFPREWEDCRFFNREAVAEAVDRFWISVEKNPEKRENP